MHINLKVHIFSVHNKYRSLLNVGYFFIEKHEHTHLFVWCRQAVESMLLQKSFKWQEFNEGTVLTAGRV